VPSFLVTLDLAGTFVFALSGALVGVHRRLDLFGVLVLSAAAATSGGIARDILIGSVPPGALADWRYVATAAAAGLWTFFRHGDVERLRSPVQVLDAAGLGLFAVTGAAKALAFGLSPLAAVLLGMLTGIGGGIARDVLVAEIPVVLRAELYAVAALVGATVVVAGDLAGAPRPPFMLAGALACFALRFLAIRHGWQLPKAGGSDTDRVDGPGPAQ
jgi:uncharacterized membrane protein YeiH